MFPTSTWVFLSTSIDATTNTQYGYRYYPSSGGSIQGLFKSLTPSGALYTIAPSTTVYWGGGSSGVDCSCIIQYVRIYIDYAANAADQVLNLALMDPSSKIIYFN